MPSEAEPSARTWTKPPSSEGFCSVSSAWAPTPASKAWNPRPADDYKDLLYVRRRFVSAEGLRQAIAKVVNATLAVRLPRIWGEATTACASDSKQFGAWDQNLLTEYHLRYGGRGVMVYWHVEKKSICIYSQLKRVSSSEASSMIEGVLRHCTDMEVNRQYVDSHGQTTVAFAFCRLLGFRAYAATQRHQPPKTP